MIIRKVFSNFISAANRRVISFPNNSICYFLKSSFSTESNGVNEDIGDLSLGMTNLTPEQSAKVIQKNKELRYRHLVIESQMNPKDRDDVRRKRMIYRAKQRGWLEADLLLGSWAVQNVPYLTSEELDQFELLLNVETIDIYNFISGKDTLPEHLTNLSVMKKLQEYALTGNMASPEGYQEIKKKTNMI